MLVVVLKSSFNIFHYLGARNFSSWQGPDFPDKVAREQWDFDVTKGQGIGKISEICLVYV